MKATLKFFIAIVATALLLPTSALSPAPVPAEPNIQSPVATSTKPVAKPATKPYPARTADPAQAEKYKSELRAIAEAKGLPESKIREIEGVIACESTWRSDAIGDDGNSMGLVQISLIYWPEVSQAQAFNPTFALNFIVDRFVEKKERLWTCWRNIYGNK